MYNFIIHKSLHLVLEAHPMSWWIYLVCIHDSVQQVDVYEKFRYKIPQTHNSHSSACYSVSFSIIFQVPDLLRILTETYVCQ